MSVSNLRQKNSISDQRWNVSVSNQRRIESVSDKRWNLRPKISCPIRDGLFRSVIRHRLIQSLIRDGTKSVSD